VAKTQTITLFSESSVRGRSLLIWVAALAIVTGSFARLYDLERMPVWHDEVYSLLRTFGFDGGRVRAEVFGGRSLRAHDLLVYQQPSPQLGFADTLSSLMTHPEHGPLFYLAARVAAPAFRSPIAGLRGTSAVLSLLVIPAIFWLAWELFEDSDSAWIAAALAACSPLNLLYAQEAREYALWILLTAAASAALLRALRTRSPRDWVVYCTLTTLGLYTYLLFALVLAVQGVYVALSLHPRRPGAGALLRAWVTAVAAAVLMFSPWIAVLVTRVSSVQQVTAWMERPVALQSLLEGWATNFARAFADFPMPKTLLLLGLIPLAWVLWRFCVQAPHSARLFTCLLFSAFVAVVLVPDLVHGGRRSLNPRYMLPSFLAVELALAYVLAMGWRASSAARRFGARTGLFLVLGLGIWSGWLILGAETWWSKNFSAANREVADLVNATERPLVIITDSAVGLGEIISLAHDLDEKVIIRGNWQNGAAMPVTGFSDIFLLTPSAKLRTAFSADYELAPVLETWQWYRAVPKPKGTGT